MFITRRQKRKVTYISITTVIIILGLYYFLSGPQQTISNVDMLEQENGQEILTNGVAYFETTKGYFIQPKTPGNYPGIVMIHEWWGLNENIKKMAEQLAQEGYLVLAVDLFKGNVATTADQARQQTGSLNQEEALNNLRAAKAYLKEQGATTIGSLGWCFGGGQSMQLAISGEPMDATVIYYGNLVTDEQKISTIQWPVLGIFGDQDASIPVGEVNEFDALLDKLNVQNEIYVYPGVGHAFANPSGKNYAPQETQDAWQKTLDFLEKNLKQN